MKIVLLISLMLFEFTTNFELYGEPTLFCKAMKSIFQLGILKLPINIQLLDKTLSNCLDLSNSTYFLNVCTNDVKCVSQSSLVVVEPEEDVSDQTLYCMNYIGHHVVVIQNYSSDKIDGLVNFFWKHLFINVTFLIRIESEISLQTFIPYADRKCNDTKLQIINQFEVKSEHWKNNQFFPKKLNNFHRCALKVTTHNNIAPYIVREEYVNGERILKGRVIEIINALSASLNFTVELVYEPSVSAWGKCIRKIANNEADLFIGNLFLDLPRTKHLDFTIPIFFEFLKFVIPPGREYTQIENFARAFDIFTWKLIFCVLVLIALLITFIGFQSKGVKKYVFGLGYRNAFMDFLSTIFGISTTSMPLANIPRMLIIKFVIFCLIMRTIYQGTLFHFLQSGGKLKPVQSLDEMIDKGYTFFMLKLYDNYLDLKERNNASKRFLNVTDFDEILEKLSDNNFKGTLMHTASLIVYKNQQKENNFTSLFCKEYLMTISMVGYLRKNFYLTDIVNERIAHFHEAGLMYVWDKLPFKRINTADTSNDKKPISLNNLKGIFMIYLFACLASVSLFMAEITFHFFIKKVVRKILSIRG